MTGFGVFGRPGDEPRVGFRAGEEVLDLSAFGNEVRRASLNPFMAAGPVAWERTLARIEVPELATVHTISA